MKGGDRHAQEREEKAATVKPRFRPGESVRAMAWLPSTGGALSPAEALTVTGYHTGDGPPWRVRVRAAGGREVWTWEWALRPVQMALEMR